MDTIYRSDAIELIRSGIATDTEADIEHVVEMFNALPPAKHKPFAVIKVDADAIVERIKEEYQIRTWIPCAEALPQNEEVVLVSLRSESRCWHGEYRRIEIGKHSETRFDRSGSGWMYLDESGADFWNDLDDGEVLAWMPMPEPYEEG